MDATDHRRIEGLLYDVDERGEGLTKWEIDFISKMIDNAVIRFSDREAEIIEQIHAQRTR